MTVIARIAYVGSLFFNSQEASKAAFSHAAQKSATRKVESVICMDLMMPLQRLASAGWHTTMCRVDLSAQRCHAQESPLRVELALPPR